MVANFIINSNFSNIIGQYSLDLYSLIHKSSGNISFYLADKASSKPQIVKIPFIIKGDLGNSDMSFDLDSVKASLKKD
ncbi:MAG TPA: hypothetical protein QKA14_00160 [Candidatus Megaira endosymbiont of Hartmannula sinica]|nr:hypothetical protein [Candidatus Megaera endosymbiont of Hartmannula sinica]